VRLSIRIAHIIKIRILPRPEKKVKLSHYTKRKIAKRERKLQKQKQKALARQKSKAAAKKQKKLDKKARRDAERSGALEKEKKPSLIESVNLIASLLEVFFKKFFKYLKIKVARLNITVATDDAAKTAILYGAVSQTVSYIIALLHRYSNLSETKNAQFSVNSDFCASKSSADVCLSFSIRVGQVLTLGLALLGRFLKSKSGLAKSSQGNGHLHSNKNNSNKKKQGR
jgi:hypothetical protein